MPILDCFLARVVGTFLGSLEAWIPIHAAKDSAGERLTNRVSNCSGWRYSIGPSSKSAPFIKLGLASQVRQLVPSVCWRLRQSSRLRASVPPAVYGVPVPRVLGLVPRLALVPVVTIC